MKKTKRLASKMSAFVSLHFNARLFNCQQVDTQSTRGRQITGYAKKPTPTLNNQSKSGA